MKKIVLFFFLILVATTGFAESFILNNQISNPVKNNKAKIIIQWATSTKDVEENNRKIMQGKKLNPDSLQVLTQTGKINLNIPKNVEYFRVLVWSKAKKEPDFLTNWVDIIPNKTYTLNTDHLVPFVLMSGMGC